MNERREAPSSAKAIVLAFAVTLLVICAVVICLGILTDDGVKSPTPVQTPRKGVCNSSDFGCGTPNAKCATGREGKFFIKNGRTYVCSGPKPLKWREVK